MHVCTEIDRLENVYESMKTYLMPFLRIVAFMAISMFITILCGLPLAAVFETGWGLLFANQIPLAIGVTVSSLFLLKNWKQTLGLSIKGRGGDITYGLLVALLIYSIAFSILWFLGDIEVVDFLLDWKGMLLSWILMFFVAYAEEVAIRGFVLGSMLDAGINKFVALLLSSILFSLLHFFNPNFSFLPFLNIVLAGILLGASYIYTRNLWFPISLHLFWNWIQGLLGFQVSGANFGASLVTLCIPKDNLMNGGAFGFEGSLLCTALQLLFIVIILRVASNRCACAHDQSIAPSLEHADE